MARTKASNHLMIAMGIAGAMILSSWLLSELGQPELGTTMMFLLIALAAGLGIFNADSSRCERQCIRNLFGCKPAVESKASEAEANPFGPEQR